MPQLLIFSVLIGAFLLYQKASAGSAFTVRVSSFDLDIRRAQLFAVPFRIKMEIENPSNEAIPVQAVSGSVFIGSTEIGTFSNLSGFTVAPRAKTSIDFGGNLSPAAALKSGVNLISAIQSGKLPSMIIKGNVNAGGFVVPFSQEFKS